MSICEVTIGGIKVKFPNNPYPSQISMMDKVGHIMNVTTAATTTTTTKTI
jgi:hypothetical protein